MNNPYKPQDAMAVWWLGQPASPVLVGEVLLSDLGRKAAFRYAKSWLSNVSLGFPLSEDLPLYPDLAIPKDRDTAAGAIEDARPDRWGERVIRLIDRPARLSILEYLYFAGDARFGALGVSLDSSAYVPSDGALLPSFDSLEAMDEVVRKVMANEPVSEVHKRLIRPGVSLGGARPKSLVQMDGSQWLVKFAEDDEIDTQMIEHAAMALARHCNLNVAKTKVFQVARGQTGANVVAIERFDRHGDLRRHAISANVALRAAGEEHGYPELAHLLRRVAPPDAIKDQQRELFRRMVFNILIDNTDDHEKNHALLRQDDGGFVLSPAFDVLPTAQGLRYQSMRVGKTGAESTVENALSECAAFGLSLEQATDAVAELTIQVSEWKEFFSGCGVSGKDIEFLARSIDGDFLLNQRERFASKPLSAAPRNRP